MSNLTITSHIKKKIQELKEPESLFTRFIIDKMASHGVVVSDEGQNELKRIFISQIQANNAEIVIPSEWIATHIPTEQSGLFENILFHEIDENETNQYKSDQLEKLDALELSLEDEAVESLSNSMYQIWDKQKVEIIAKEKLAQAEFTKYLNQVWGEALDKLQTLICFCLEKVVEFRDSYATQPTKVKDWVFDALTYIYARGSLTSKAILILLKEGYADDAYARWRTLHEITVIAVFIEQKGNFFAEAYLLHGVIKEQHILKEHKNGLENFGYIMPDSKYADAIDKEVEKLKRRYPNRYMDQYGWATTAFPPRSSGKYEMVTFKQIEEEVDFDVFRPFYEFANNNIHGGSYALDFQFGLPSSLNLGKKEKIFLAGASSFGIEEVGQKTVMSLVNLTTTVLMGNYLKNTSDRNIEYRALVKTIYKFADETFDAFDKAYNTLNQKPNLTGKPKRN